MKINSIMGHASKVDWKPTNEDWKLLVKNIDAQIMRLHLRISELEKKVSSLEKKGVYSVDPDEIDRMEIVDAGGEVVNHPASKQGVSVRTLPFVTKG